MNTEKWQFLAGCAGGETPQHLFLAVESIDNISSGEIKTMFCVYHQGEWYSYATLPNWTTIAMTALKSQRDDLWIIFAIDQSGNIWELTPFKNIEKCYKYTDKLGITNICTIDNEVYVCGMGRYFSKRDLGGNWVDISAPLPSYDDGVIGFVSVAGVKEEIYAVGWKGEIWLYKNKKWLQEDSPTNSNFNSITYSESENTYYIVGDSGVIVKGRSGEWSIIDVETDFNLLDVCIYDNNIYICSDFSVFILDKSNLNYDLSFLDEELPLTCLKLFAAKGNGLFSIGSQDVYQKLNKEWKRICE